MSDEKKVIRSPWPAAGNPPTPERAELLERRYAKALYDIVTETRGLPGLAVEMVNRATTRAQARLDAELKAFLAELGDA